MSESDDIRKPSEYDLCPVADPRVRPDSVMLTDTPLDIATPVVMTIAVLVDVETEAEPVQDDTLQVTEAVQMK